MLATAALASAAGAAPAAAATTGAAAQLVVAPRNGGLVGRGGDLDVDVQVTNRGSVALPAGRLTFSVETSPVASTTALIRQITDPVGVPLGNLLPASGRTPALDPGTSTVVRVRLDGGDLDDNLGGADAADGARLLYVQFASSTVREVAESTVVRMSGRAPRIGFGTVVPITMPTSTTGVVDVAEQEALTGSGGAWSDALEAARAMPSATIALDPAVIASVRLAGDTAPASAVQFLSALQDLPNQVVRLPYADGDLTLQRAAGLRDPLEPQAFTAASTATASPSSATPTPTPTPAPSSTASAADLTDWDWSKTTLSWPVPGTTTASDLAALGRRGPVLLGSGDLKDTTRRGAGGPSTTVGGSRVLVADATLSSLLATSTAGGVQGRAALAPLVGSLATDAVTGATPAVLAVAGRAADPAGLARVLRLLGAQQWVDGRSADDLLGEDQAVGVDLKALAPSGIRAATARSLVEGREAVSRLASAVPDPDALTAPTTLAVAGLLSAEWRADETRWSAAAATAAAAADAMTRRVAILRSDSSIVSTDGQMRVVVQNGLDQAVQVDVSAAVNNGRLQFDGRRTRLTVPANAQNRALLGFRTIANGPAQVTLTLATPDGSQLGQPSVRRVQVQAGFDVIVAVVLLTLLGMLLALGVYRNVVRRRKPKAAA